MPKRVLVVSYFFPPVAGVGIERTLKHVTHLPESGWEPVVVAPANPAYRLIDAASVARLPSGLQVHRAPGVEPAHLRRLIRRLIGGVGRTDAASASGATDGAGQAGRGLMGPLRDAANRTWATLVPLLFFPDEQLLFAPGSILAGLRAHRERPIQAVYSSSPPISGHLAAAVLSQLTGAPWIADFRDPWIGNAIARPLPPVHRRVQAELERLLLRHADRAVFATATLRDRYAERYPDRAEGMVHVPNGYDLTELLDAAPEADEAAGTGHAFRLVYTGSLHSERELGLFVDGVELLRARRPELAERLRVEFIGWFSQANLALARERLPAVDPVVRHLGFRPRAEAIARLRSADAALYLVADGPDRDLIVAAKLYEYLGLDKPVLALTPPGEARQVLEELGWGVIEDPTPEGVAAGLERIMDESPRDGVADPGRRYEQRALTRRLAAVLDAATD